MSVLLALHLTMAIKKGQVPILKQLCKCNNHTRKKILKTGGKPLQLCLRECAVNTLKGNVNLSKHQFNKLRRYRKNLRDLSHKKTSLKKRLQIEQKGGFLASLLIPILGSLLRRKK